MAGSPGCRRYLPSYLIDVGSLDLSCENNGSHSNSGDIKPSIGRQCSVQLVGAHHGSDENVDDSSLIY